MHFTFIFPLLLRHYVVGTCALRLEDVKNSFISKEVINQLRFIRDQREIARTISKRSPTSIVRSKDVKKNCLTLEKRRKKLDSHKEKKLGCVSVATY